MDRVILVADKKGSILTKEIIAGEEICVIWDNHHYTWAEEAEEYGYKKEFRCEERREYSIDSTKKVKYLFGGEHLPAHLLALLHFLEGRGLVFVDYEWTISESISEMASRYPLWFNVEWSNIERRPKSRLNKITLCKKE